MTQQDLRSPGISRSRSALVRSTNLRRYPFAALLGAAIAVLAAQGCSSDSSTPSGTPGGGGSGNAGAGGSGGSAGSTGQGSLQGINTVWVALDTAQTGELLRVHPATAEIPPSPEPEDPSEPSIRWDMVADGKVLAQGRIADPWAVHTDFGEDGTADPKYGRAGGRVEVRVNVPDADGKLTFYVGEGAGGGLQSQNKTGLWEWFLSLFKSDKEEPPAATSVPGLKMLVDHGKCPGRVNLLILPDGFTESELPTFQSSASAFVEKLKELPAYGDNWDYINVWTLDVASKDSGISDPAKDSVKSTAFGTSFGDDVTSVRRCIYPRNAGDADATKLRAEAEAASGANQTIIIANTTEWGGCAGGNLIAQSRHSGGGRVLAHELGHSLFKLADEYDYRTCSSNAGKGKPNTSADAQNPPWKDLINTKELPTTADSASTVGTYEGAQYCKTGVYRPTHHYCIMRDSNQDFCKVCKAEADKVFTKIKAEAAKGGECGADAGSDAEPPSCFNGGPACDSGKVCSWNGKDKGYCCKTPFTASKTCFTDDECAPDICAFGGPPNNFFYCVPANDPQCN